RDVSLTVVQGELVAIIGGTRSGNATLLNSMSGLCPPTSGAIFRHVPGDARQAGGPRSGQIGYVPRGDTIYPVLPLARARPFPAAPSTQATASAPPSPPSCLPAGGSSSSTSPRRDSTRRRPPRRC